jgi:hypothetical protein
VADPSRSLLRAYPLRVETGGSVKCRSWRFSQWLADFAFPRGEPRRPIRTLSAERGAENGADYSGQGGRVWAKSTTICPKGRSTCALPEIIGPTSPGDAVLTNRAWHGAASGLAAPDADGARAPSTPRLAISRNDRRCRNRIPPYRGRRGRFCLLVSRARRTESNDMWHARFASRRRAAVCPPGVGSAVSAARTTCEPRLRTNALAFCQR